MAARNPTARPGLKYTGADGKARGIIVRHAPEGVMGEGGKLAAAKAAPWLVIVGGQGRRPADLHRYKTARAAVTAARRIDRWLARRGEASYLDVYPATARQRRRSPSTGHIKRRLSNPADRARAGARAAALASALTRAMHSTRSTPARLRALQAAAARATRAARQNPKKRRPSKKRARRVVTRTTTVRTVSNPRRKGASMARRRRKNPGRRRRSAKQRAAFKKMIAGLKRARRRLGRKVRAAAKAFSRTNPRARRRRRKNPSALIVNPSRRRRRRTRSNPPMARKRKHRRRNPIGRRRRRRNPGGMGGVIKQTLMAAVPAAGVGAALGFLDTKVLKDKPKIIGVLAKVGVGVGAAIALKSKPQFALPIAGAAFGTLGYQGGVKIAGGVVSSAPTEAAKELAAMAATDEETFGVLTESLEGMGVLSIEGYADDAEDLFEGTEPLDFEPAFDGADGAY